jgi:hypothetical protein
MEPQRASTEEPSAGAVGVTHAVHRTVTVPGLEMAGAAIIGLVVVVVGVDDRVVGNRPSAASAVDGKGTG